MTGPSYMTSGFLIKGDLGSPVQFLYLIAKETEVLNLELRTPAGELMRIPVTSRIPAFPDSAMPPLIQMPFSPHNDNLGVVKPQRSQRMPFSWCLSEEVFRFSRKGSIFPERWHRPGERDLLLSPSLPFSYSLCSQLGTGDTVLPNAVFPASGCFCIGRKGIFQHMWLILGRRFR